ncbi:MAG: hypothetical protein WCK01_01005 [Candidatus Uhrbacteria bacterium]
MDAPKVSQLPKNEERFLSKLIAMFVALGYITVEKLYEVFPPLALFTGYENEPDRRRALFGLTKLGSDYASEFDLAASAIILEKGVKLTDVKLVDLYQVVSPDELVRVHDRKVLFTLIKSANAFATKDDKSQRLMVHAINDVVVERLGSDTPATVQKHAATIDTKVHQFVVDAIGESVFVSDYVPAEARARILKIGLQAYQEKRQFTPNLLFEAVPMPELVSCLPFEKLVPVIDAVALKFGWIEPPKTYKVEKPSADLLPDAVLDSIPPPASSDDPEVVSETMELEPDDEPIVEVSGPNKSVKRK